MDFARFPLGEAGTSFIQTAFEGGLTLARMVAHRSPWAEGTSFALLPEGTSPSLLTRFERGGVAPGGGASVALARLIESTLSDSPMGVLVAENALAKRPDPALEGETATRFSLGDEIYEYVRSVDAGVDRLVRILRLADAGYSMNVVVARLTTSSDLPEHRGEVRSEVLEQLVLTVELAVARAYDGEGYVVWSSNLPAGAS